MIDWTVRIGTVSGCTAAVVRLSGRRGRGSDVAKRAPAPRGAGRPLRRNEVVLDVVLGAAPRPAGGPADYGQLTYGNRSQSLRDEASTTEHPRVRMTALDARTREGRIYAPRSFPAGVDAEILIP